MTKADIIRKLTSRKFWAMVASYTVSLLIYFGDTATDAERIATLIMGGAAIVAYILGEGWADASN